MDIYIYAKNRSHTSKQTNGYIEKSLQYLGFSGFTIKRTPKGKPYVEGPEIFVGVTHTRDFLIVGVAGHKFGIDAENAERRIQRTNAVVKRFFSALEKKTVEEAENPADMFLKIWVKKEAIAKYGGEGIACLREVDTADIQGIFTFVPNRYNLIICVYADRQDSIQIHDRTERFLDRDS